MGAVWSRASGFGYSPALACDGRRRFEAMFWFAGWDCLSLGAHLCWSLPNVEVHVPFGFLRIGWRRDPETPSEYFVMERR